MSHYRIPNTIGEDEKIIRVIHRHWFNIFQQFILIIIVIGILLTGVLVIPVMFPALLGEGMDEFYYFIQDTAAVIIWIYAFLIWIDYYFDVWIVTDKRIINIEQKGLFRRSISEAKLERVQDVQVEIHGLLPTILNYGDVFVQTASESEQFHFRKIPDPLAVKSIIMGMQKK